MQQTGSRAAGYVIGVVLLVPFAILGAFFLGYMGPTGFVVAAAVTAAGALFAWLSRTRPEDIVDASRPTLHPWSVGSSAPDE